MATVQGLAVSLCVDAARRFTCPFALAVLGAGALDSGSASFGCRDAKNRETLPVPPEPKLNLRARPPELVPLLLSATGVSPARSIARRSRAFHAVDRLPSSATFASSCAVARQRLGWGVCVCCPAPDGPALAAEVPSASSCAGRSTASDVAILAPSLLASRSGAEPVTWRGARRRRYLLLALVRGRARSGARFSCIGTELACPGAIASVLPMRLGSTRAQAPQRLLSQLKLQSQPAR